MEAVGEWRDQKKRRKKKTIEGAGFSVDRGHMKQRLARSPGAFVGCGRMLGKSSSSFVKEDNGGTSGCGE